MPGSVRRSGNRRAVWLIAVLALLIVVAIVCGPDFIRGLHDGWAQAAADPA